MEVIPAIDLMSGRCVQLIGGDPRTRKGYGDPVEKAMEWVREGARMLHIVDLDAAFGSGSNFSAALKIKKAASVPVEFGGGIRSLKAARSVLDALDGEDRVITGTLAVKEYPEFKTLRELGGEKDRLIVSVDSKRGFVAVKGWREKSGLKAAELMAACGGLVWGFLYTDVDVEGRMHGINADRIREVVKATDRPVIVSGGISSKEDVKACEDAGAWGVILGKALYEGKIKLEDVV